MPSPDDPRAQLIALQVALADEKPTRARRHELRQAADALLAAHPEWAALARNIATKWVFRRGVIDEIETSAARFLAHGKELLDVEPVLRVTLHDTTPELLAEIVDAGLVRSFSRLTIRGTVEDAGASALAGAKKAQLGSLNLGSTSLGTEGLADLVKSPLLATCRSLALTGNEIGDEGAEILAKAPSLKALERLYLANCGISDEGASALAKSTKLPLLHTLGLNGNDDITDESEAVFKKSRLAKLRRLELPTTSW
jgi:hypothetical protein